LKLLTFCASGQSIAIHFLETLKAGVRDDSAGFDSTTITGRPNGHFGLTIKKEHAGRFDRYPKSREEKVRTW